MFEKLFTKRNNEKPVIHKSCDALGNRLVFFGKMVAYCSNGNPAKKRAYPVIYDNFTGIDCVDFKNLKKRILNDKKALFDGNVPESCLGCSNISEVEYNPDFAKKPEISYIQFSDYGLCNSRCTYCNSWKNTKKENDKYSTISGEIDSYDIMPLIKELIKQKILTKNTVIDYAGGEPTIYRQFEDSLKYLLKYGIKNVLIFSNAIKYSKAIEEGLEKGIITLTVSVDAGTKNMHKLVKGVASYDSVYENLKNYITKSKIKKNVISKYVVVPDLNDSTEEVQIWIEKSYALGIRQLILNADNRIFEQDFSENTIKKLCDIHDFFIEKCKELNIEYQIYSNMQFAKNYIK